LRADDHGNKGHDDNDKKTPARITVTFGTGNNNAQAGNTPNHHILPQEFTVRITALRRTDGGRRPASVNHVSGLGCGAALFWRSSPTFATLPAPPPLFNHEALPCRRRNCEGPPSRHSADLADAGAAISGNRRSEPH
jgi:hypothetical protein